MENAILFYQEIDCYNDIVELLRKHEDIFLDFKETRTTEGRMLEDDRSTFSKAASGFAHQEGGVLVWGIEARKDPATEIDCAINLKPINNVKRFLSDLNKYIKDSTEPAVDGIQHKIIFENNDEDSNRGFVVSFFPKSDRVHRALGPGKTRNGFYKRHGDSFSELTTNEIKELFFRTLSPDLDLIVHTNQNKLTLILKNSGVGIAKYCCLHISLTRRKSISGKWYDEEGNPRFRFAQKVTTFESGKHTTQVRLNPGIVIFPGEKMVLAQVSCGEGREPIEVEYRIFSENMIPKEGEITIQNPDKVDV